METVLGVIVTILFVGFALVAVLRLALYAFGVKEKPDNDTKLFDDWK
jgi:hypothetical protein